MPLTFQVRVREPVDFIRAALTYFQPHCFLSLEGDLSHYDSSRVPDASDEPTEVLRRSTIWPKQQFVILPVTSMTLETISRQVLPQVGLKHRILHVQVAFGGRLVLGAYDAFHRECCWVDQCIGQDTISSWKESGIIGWYEPREWPNQALQPTAGRSGV
jgi:hypothetical protein